MPRKYGYSKVGERCYGAHSWNAKGRENIIGALVNNSFTACAVNGNIDSDTFNNQLGSGKRPAQTTTYASFGGYVENFVESCQFTNFDGSPFLTLKLKEDK